MKRVPLSSVAEVTARIGWHGLSTADHRDDGDYLVTGTEIVRRGVDWSTCNRVERSVYDRDPRIQLAQGDVLVTKDGTIGKVGLISDLPGLATLNSGVFRVRPKPLLDPQFLMWCLSSDLLREFQERLGGGSTINHLYQRDFTRFQLPLPPVEEQRRIADFLDDQVARIDQAIQVGDSQIEELAALAGQRFLAQVRESPAALNWPHVRLGHLLRQFTNGYVGPTRDILVDEGVPYVQSLHVKNGQIDFDRRPYFVPKDWHDARPRIHLRQGDVLIVQTGDIGSIAVVPRGFMDASCHALIIARPRRDLIHSEYLGEFLRSPLGQSELLSRATGALHPHLESGIKDAVIVLPPLADQDRITRTIKSIRNEVRNATSAGVQRRALLEERKRAVITAAVTGELDVTTARPIGVRKWVPNVGASVEGATAAQGQVPSIGGIV